jgi:hypothetical protein
MEMTEIGDLWREFAVETARIVKKRSSLENPYDGVANLLLTIAERERKVFQELLKIKNINP